MDESILVQIKIFFYAIFYGGLLIALYDGWRFFWYCWRKRGKKNQVTDMIYWSLAGIALFLFVEWENEGNIRGYLFLGWFLGMLCYWKVLRRLIKRLWNRIAGRLKKIRKAVKIAIERR